jgi:hypothetical protein
VSDYATAVAGHQLTAVYREPEHQVIAWCCSAPACRWTGRKPLFYLHLYAVWKESVA